MNTRFDEDNNLYSEGNEIHYRIYQTGTTATVFTWYFRLFLHRSKAIITEYKAAVAKAKPPKSLKEATSPKASIERPPKSPPKPRPTPKYADPKMASIVAIVVRGALSLTKVITDISNNVVQKGLATSKAKKGSALVNSANPNMRAAYNKRANETIFLCPKVWISNLENIVIGNPAKVPTAKKRGERSLVNELTLSIKTGFVRFAKKGEKIM